MGKSSNSQGRRDNRSKPLEPKYVCPICGEPVEVYSRPCGYLRPISNWNDGKQQEFEDRVNFDIVGRDEPKIIESKEE